MIVTDTKESLCPHHAVFSHVRSSWPSWRWLPLQVAAAADDPLPSWNNGAVKRAIMDFVQRVTTPGGTDCVPEPERIATFDNDGTLWTEQPMYFQLAFACDRVKALAPQHPTNAEREWAYDRTSHIGRLDKALDEAQAKGWMVVDMKQDLEDHFPASG